MRFSFSIVKFHAHSLVGDFKPEMPQRDVAHVGPGVWGCTKCAPGLITDRKVGLWGAGKIAQPFYEYATDSFRGEVENGEENDEWLRGFISNSGTYAIFTQIMCKQFRATDDQTQLSSRWTHSSSSTH